MGIPGLFGFLEYYHQSKPLKNVIKNKNIGIDIFWFMHRCKGNMDILRSSLSPYYQNSNKCYFVFDGKVPEDKKNEKELQRAEREKVNLNIAVLESQILNDIDEKDKDYLLSKIEQMKKDNWTPRSEFINEVKNCCKSWYDNIIIENAPFEADTWLVKMEKELNIECVISNDSDLIVNGCMNLIRPKIINGFVKVYNIKHFIHKIKCSINEWNDLCQLIKNYKGNDIIIVYSWWRYYRQPEIIYYLYKDSFNVYDKNININIQKKSKSISPTRRF